LQQKLNYLLIFEFLKKKIDFPILYKVVLFGLNYLITFTRF